MAKKSPLTNKKYSAPGADTRSFSKQQDLPLVSILTVCRNAASNIRCCIESVLSQDYPRIEYVIQDGNSTDDTLKIIAEYGDRIKLESRVDTPNKANYWGLERCSGEIIGMCWTDEELLPGAVSWGVEQLLDRPSAGGIFGDVLSTDGNGKIFDHQKSNSLKWDIKKYLCWEIIPNYCSSYFRKSALIKSGFFNYDIEKHCCMYDYYAKVGIHYPIYYIPGFVAKFAQHSKQLSSGSKMLQLLVELIDNSFDAILQQPNTPFWVKDLEPRMRAGIRLAMIPSMVRNAKDYETTQRLIDEAFSYHPDKEFFQRVCQSIADPLIEDEQYAIFARLCDHLEAHGALLEDMGLAKAHILYKQGFYQQALPYVKAALEECLFNPTAQMMFVELVSKTNLKSATSETIKSQTRSTATNNNFIYRPTGSTGLSTDLQAKN